MAELRKINETIYIKFKTRFELFRYYTQVFLMIIGIIIFCLFFYQLLTHIQLLKSDPCQLCIKQGYSCMKLR